MALKDILEGLNKVNGLNNVNILGDEDKDIIRNLEEENNIGVLECIDRNHVVMVVHNSGFREPEKNMVIKENGIAIFPALEFPEVKAKDVVSSSPGINVHEYLRRRFNLNIDNEHATLLIGFNL
ncbi:hypothetical protein HYX17_01525 [Candidatus Woesearchaeota archaeon]|nr:hypothetical protein [Candidatus Woesearchaeota archaeon]